MIVGFDLDGIVAPNPWARYNRSSRKGIIGKCVAIISIFCCYVLRKPHEPIVNLLKEYDERGHRIIFISGIWGVARPIVLMWLKWHHIPFYKIVLRWKGSCKEFKTRYIFSTGCEMYVEDDSEIAGFIKERYAGRIIQEGLWQIGDNLIYVLSFGA